MGLERSLKAIPEAVVPGGMSDSRKAAFCATFSKKVAEKTLFLSFLSFYKETKPKKIVVARIPRCSRLYASAAAFKERLTTGDHPINALRRTEANKKKLRHVEAHSIK